MAKREVGEIVANRQRVPPVMRLPDEMRADVEAITNVIIPTESGLLLPLHEVVNVHETARPSTINREWGRRIIKVRCNVRDRDVAGFVHEVCQRVNKEVSLP